MALSPNHCAGVSGQVLLGMTDLEKNSFVLSAIGRQADSKKETCPAYSIGTEGYTGQGYREVQAMKVFLSRKLTQRIQQGRTAPGPHYDVPKHMGRGPAFAFPQEEQRPPLGGPYYPDSSVDLTCATVDSQKVKFAGSAHACFGSEMRMGIQNAEILVTNPNLMLGMESPGAAEYSPQEDAIRRRHPKYSFADNVEERWQHMKPTSRMSLPPSGTPRTVGPNSHRMPSGIGQQPLSARRSSPAWSLSGQKLDMSSADLGPYLDTAPAFSSLGRQVVSTSKSSGTCAFGKASRETAQKMAMCMTHTDRGPAGQMKKLNFHMDLPKTAPASVKRYGL